MNIQKELAPYRDQPVNGRNKYTTWNIQDDDSLHLVMKDNLLAEVSVSESCMKEPVNCVVHVPHAFRGEDMAPLVFRANGINAGVSAVDLLLQYTGAHQVMRIEHDKEEAERRRFLAKQLLAEKYARAEKIREENENKALTQLPAILDGKEVKDYPVMRTTGKLSRRQGIRVADIKGDENPFMKEEAQMQREMLRNHTQALDTIKQMTEQSDVDNPTKVLQTVNANGDFYSELFEEWNESPTGIIEDIFDEDEDDADDW